MDTPTAYFQRLLVTSTFVLAFLLGPLSSYAQCPTMVAMMVDACGQERRDEFIIFESGCGFNTSDFFVDISSFRNVDGPENNDINFNMDNWPADQTPCGIANGDLSVLSGCPNAVAVGPGFDVPPNAYVIFQFNVDPGFVYDFTALCSSGQPIYVFANACDRSQGALSNATGALDSPTTIGIVGVCQNTYIYDRTVLSLADGAYWNALTDTYGVNCAAPPVPPAPEPTIFNNPGDQNICGSFTLPPITGTGLTGNEAYFTGPNGTGMQLFPGDNVSTSGTIYIFDPLSGCPEESFLVTITPAIDPTFAITDTYCQGESTDMLPISSLEGVLGSWSPSIISNINSGSYTFTPSPGQCANPFTLNVTITPASAPSFSITDTYCQGSSPDPLPIVSDDGIIGSWSPPSINSSNSGTYTFTPNPGQCANPFTLNVSITPSVTPSFSIPDSYCAGSSVPPLPATSDNGVAGSWAPANIDNTNSGNYTFTPNPGQCANSFTLSVTIANEITPSFSFNTTYCQGATTDPLPTISDNGIAGSWSPTVIDNNNSGSYTFTPDPGECGSPISINVTVASSINPTFSIPDTYCQGEPTPPLPNVSDNGIAGSWSPAVIDNTFSGNYTFTPNPGQCANPTSVNVTITPSNTPTFSIPNSFCQGEPTPPLPNFSDNGIAGSWTPAFIDNTFSGNYTFTPDPGQCANPTSVNVTITPSNTPTFSIPNTFCQGEPTPPLPNVSDNGIAGSWTPAFIDNTFSGNYTFTPDPGQCANPTSVNVTITPSNTPTFSIPNSFCQGEPTPPLPNVSDNGIAGSWTPAVIDNTFSGNYTFTPNPGQCANPTSVNVTITPSNTPTFSIPNTFCQGEPTPPLPNVSNNGIAGSWTPAVIDNTFSGNYTFTPDPGQCANPTSVNVTITPSNTPTFSIPNTFCQGEPTPPLPNVSNNGIAGSWTPAVIDNTFSGNYTFTPNPGQCANPTSVNVTITPSNTPTFSIPNSFCQGEPTPPLPNVSDNGIAGSWSPAFIDNTFSGNYTFTPNPGQCAASFSLSVNITPAITPEFFLITNYCQGEQTDFLPNVSVNGITGSWFPATIDNAFSDSYTFTPAPGQCAEPYTLNVTISPAITPEFFILTDYCQGEITDPLPNISNNGITGSWSPTTINNISSEVYTFTPDPGQCASTFVIGINISPLTAPIFNIQDQYCAGSPVATLPSNADNGINGSWFPSVIDNQNSATYTFVPDNGECATTYELDVIIEPAEVPIFDFGTTFCEGDPLFNLPTLSTNGIVGTWFPSSIDPSTIQGEVFATFTPNPGQCAEVLNDIALNVQAPPQLNLMIDQPIDCNGNTASLQLDINGQGPFTFDWSDDTLDGIQNPSGLTPNFYMVTVSDVNNCSATTDITITSPNPLTINCAQLAPVSTIGGNDGQATINISGGTPDYSIEYQGPVSGNFTASGNTSIDLLEAGNYNITITDANGCTETCSFTISDPSCNLTLDITATDIDCFGNNNGAIDLTVNGANGNISFDWNIDALDGTEDPQNLAPGNYEVTITDEAGCSATTSVSISQPNMIVLACAESQAVSTIGGNDGQATINISGGTPDYSIEYQGPVSGNFTANGNTTIDLLEAGNYNITITDANSCTETCSFTISDPSCNLTLDISATDIDCFGNDNGAIDLTVNGANGNISFDWNIDALDGTEYPQNLAPGNYEVTVTDEAGCSAITSISISQPDMIVLACAESQAVSTIGGNDGQATINISGGTPDYSIEYQGPVSGNFTASGNTSIDLLEAGNYNITITDANGCTETCSFTISDPSCNLTLDISATDIDCFGNDNGAIDLTVNGANGNLSFDWNLDALDDTEDPQNLAPGNYEVTVTDEAGCSATTSVTISQPNMIVLACAESQAVSTIGGNDGQASINISGGTPDYTIEYQGPVSGNFTANGNTTIDLLEAGNYNITITDANGCAETCSFTISDPSCNLTLDITATDIDCFGNNNGAIDLTVNGANGNLTFDWNIDALDGTEDPQNLAPGNYEVTVTDEAGCSATTSISISQPDMIVLACAESQAVSTIGGNDGQATINISGGTPDYSIEYQGPVSGNFNANANTTIDLLEAGNYNITITDANGCTETCSFTISDPSCNLTLDITATDIDCFGNDNGVIDLTVNGANGNLSFDWNIDALDGTEAPQNLAPGNYEVTVTDEAGCSATTSISISQPNMIVLACAESQAVSTIGGNDGQATINISGGTPDYNIEYQEPVSGNFTANGNTSIDLLEAGNYNITITDANGCTETCSFTISDPSCNLTLDITATDIDCFGNDNGAIDLTVNSANGNISFDWNVDALDGTEDPQNLASGNYEVTITDEAGCSATTSVSISQPNMIVLACAESQAVSTIGGNDGQATINISGGTPDYSIEYQGPVSGNFTASGNTSIDLLEAGNYNITITDANGCTETCSFTISDPSCNLTLDISATDIDCFGNANGAIDLTVNGANGNLTFDWNIDALDGTEDPQNLAPGNYEVTITDEAGCSATTSVSISQPNMIVLACAESQAVSTIGGNDGQATINISGGTPDYSIEYQGPVSGNFTASGNTTIDMLEAGNYNITITDANGCAETCSFTISDPSCNLTLDISATDIDCFGNDNGAIDLTVNGANGNLTFDWNIDALDGTEDPQNLAPGNYEVTVTDEAGCSAITSISISQPNMIVLACAESQAVSTIGGNDGQATINISGGTPDYSIEYQGPVSGNFTASGNTTIDMLEAGNYNITITDANGCTETCSFIISDPSCNLTLDITTTDIDCFGNDNGAIDLTVNGANGNLTFDWNIDALDGTEDPQNLAPGNYEVTVTDEAGCSATTSITISQPNMIVLACAESQVVSTIGGNDGQAIINISGGTPDYSIEYQGPVSGNFTASGNTTIDMLEAGNYNITITDANGCTETCSFIISDPSCNLTLDITTTDIDCFGNDNGAIDLTVNGANGNLTFDWNIDALDGTEDPQNLPPGNYEVTVTDEAGCNATASVSIFAPSEITPIVTIIPPTCIEGSTGQIQIDTITGGNENYSYSLDGEFYEAVNQFPIQIDALGSGFYTLFVQDAFGCSQMIDVTIPDVEELIMDFGEDQEVTLGDSILLRPETNFTPVAWEWSSTQFLSQADTFITYASPMQTTVYQLTLTDANGCSVTDEITVFVNTTLDVYIPNAFSPNDDGFNDEFYIFAGDQVELVESFQIFDRWGNQIFFEGPFAPNDPNHGWDGTKNGQAMSPAVFVYFAKIRLVSGTTTLLKGEVTLLR